MKWFPAAMSEFKFACPVCGQRMAVDSSATGARVECPTCFQIIIVPKAPVEGSKYQLSATQFIRPVVLPPVPKPAAPVAPQRKHAVLIFVLILLCAVATALFVREKIIGLQEEQARNESTNAAPVVVNPLWTLDLAKAKFPEQIAAGEIHGRHFVCRQAVLLHDFLVLRSGPGWQSEMAANIFFVRAGDAPDGAGRWSGRSFDVSTNQADSIPAVSMVWRDGNMRITESFTNGYAMKLEFGTISDNRLPGKIYLCLPDEMKSCVVGTFTAEIQDFRPRRDP
jgi:hypothetical protein